MIKNGKLFGKINLFDLLVIVLICLFICGVCSNFILSSKDKAQEVTATYEIEVKSIRRETIDAFEIGHTVVEKGSSSPIGKIAAINYEDAYDLMETLDGKVINAPIENRFHLIITIETDNASKDINGVVMSGKYKILEGKDITFLTQKAQCQGTIQNLKVVKWKK